MILWRPILAAAACLLAGAFMGACKSTQPAETPAADTKDGKKASDTKKDDKPADAAPPPIDVSFLLSMNFNEAKTLSAQTIEVAPFYKVAADSIEVTRVNDDGTPRRVRAKGRVFVEMAYLEPAKALCQELLISEDEVILRGKPVLQRGGSTLEGVEDYTVFYMFGTRLRAIGAHRLTNVGQLVTGPDGLPMPTLGAWTDAPNPLLPPLTESAVPDNVRAELMRAAEAEMLHQQTRAQFGPATEETKPKPDEPKKIDEKDTQPIPNAGGKSKSKTEKKDASPPPATPPAEKKGIFSRMFGSKPKEEPKPELPPATAKKKR
ncbi:MAG: hypothetical protein JNG86_06330 [Verrucomicrobiaceae bacterium]|nr:hypothetical protein [Verrucomicrobiaceae bacterium]